MGKLHKEIGQLIVQSAEDPEKSDSQVIQVTLIGPAACLRVLRWRRWAVLLVLCCSHPPRGVAARGQQLALGTDAHRGLVLEASIYGEKCN